LMMKTTYSTVEGSPARAGTGIAWRAGPTAGTCSMALLVKV